MNKMKYLMILLMGLVFFGCGDKDEDEVKSLPTTDYIIQEGLDATELDKGVYISFIKKTTGRTPTVDNKIRVAYEGYLTDKTRFDANENATFILRNLIRGWQIGMKEMPVGSKAILVIPSNMAYGSRGSGIIPPDATIVFDVELLEILE